MRQYLRRTLLGLSLVGLWACADGAPRSDTHAASASPTASSAASNAPVGEVPADVKLEFRREGKAIATMALSQIVSKVTPVTLEIHDPYYGKMKRFRAVPLAPVVELGFASLDVPLAQQEYLLRANDGFTVPMRGSVVFESGGHIAFADLDVPDWEPIGPRKSNPAPLYLVWSGSQQTIQSHPRPYQLAVIEMTSFDVAFPHVVPKDSPQDGPARRGLALFRKHCILCHAMNREGGRVGPELNVPQSIVEYRPEDQIKAYIRNPLTFRYGAMPAHGHLTDPNLDDLVAYFTAMKDQKHDPDAGKGTH